MVPDPDRDFHRVDHAVTAALEAELGLPIYDSVAITLWKSLLVTGVDPGLVKGWGRVFQSLRTQDTRNPPPASAMTAS